MLENHSFPSNSARSDRTGLSFYVQIKQPGTDYYNARISDLSVSGFKLSCQATLIKHKTVFIEIQGLQLLSAKVRWYEGGFYGCEFNDTLHPAVFDHLLSKIKER